MTYICFTFSITILPVSLLKRSHIITPSFAWEGVLIATFSSLGDCSYRSNAEGKAALLPTEKATLRSDMSFINADAATGNLQTQSKCQYLLINRLKRLTLSNFKPGASFFSLPLKVALNALHGMKINVSAEPSQSSRRGTVKSYSYDTVDCSRPVSGSGGKVSSLIVNVYRFSTLHRQPVVSSVFSHMPLHQAQLTRILRRLITRV